VLPVALALIAAFTALNIVGIKESAGVNIAFTAIEAAGLILVIAVAVVRADLLAPLAAGLDASLLPATALVFFAYLGFENIASLAEEAHEPERAIPRAVLLSVAITATLYVAVALAAVALAPPAALAASDSPLVTAVRAESPVAARVLGAVALFATANTGLIALVTVSRVAYGMARDGELPAVMARTLPGRHTPWVAAIVLGGLAAALLPLGGVATIASLSSFGALAAFVAVDVAVIVLRRRQPRARRPFRVPGAIAGVPVLAVVGALASLVLVTQLERAALIGGAVTLAVGLAIGLVRQATGARS
jgi:amino acid transporter